jgi:TAT (twin-arginine translocation) pathway-exported protein
MSKTNRRTFLKAAGAATGAAIIGTVPAVAEAASEPSRELVEEPSKLLAEPVVAIVRDARKSEVTIVSGRRETTYRDRALVKRLLDAAKAHGGVR